MMNPVLDIELFRKDAFGQVPLWERQRSQKAMLWMLEGLCRTNQDIIRAQAKEGRPVPLLYESGIAYKRENGTENWQDIYRNLELMSGDCEDLACHRVAELRENFRRQASPYVTWRRGPDGAFHYHCLVLGKGPGGWRIEDPSRKLGMGFEDLYETMGRPQRDQLVGFLDKIQKRVSIKKLRGLREVG
jgi:hypothetical protein